MENNSQENLLNYIPVHNIQWQETAETKRVVLLKPKFKNRFLKQYLLPQLKNPMFKVKLDDYGSSVWKLIDGKRTILNIADKLKESAGKDVEPVYERVGQFMVSLEKYRFIKYRE